jgi:hypothetical protein
MLCVYESSPINFWMPEPISMKLGTCIMAIEPISRAYFVSPSHRSVCLYVSPIVASFKIRKLRQKSWTIIPSSRMWRRVDLVWTDVSEEFIAICCFLLTLVPRSRIFLPRRWRQYVPPKRRFTQKLHGATSQKTVFFIVTAVKTSNPTKKVNFRSYVRILKLHVSNNQQDLLYRDIFLAFVTFHFAL